MCTRVCPCYNAQEYVCVCLRMYVYKAGTKLEWKYPDFTCMFKLSIAERVKAQEGKLSKTLGEVK